MGCPLCLGLVIEHKPTGFLCVNSHRNSEWRMYMYTVCVTTSTFCLYSNFVLGGVILYLGQLALTCYVHVDIFAVQVIVTRP